MEKTIEIPEGYAARIEGNKVILEPKESKDEIVRRALIELVSNDKANGYTRFYKEAGITCDDAIAFLERQKTEPENAEELTTMMNHPLYLKGFEKGQEVCEVLSKQEQPSLPSNLDEAAEEFAHNYDMGACDGIAQDCFKAGAEWQRERILADIIKLRDAAENRGLNFGAVCGFQIALDELEQRLTGKH